MRLGIDPDPPNSASLTSADSLDRKMPVLWVFRDDDDGMFQFHSANGSPDDLKDARVVGLGTILLIDSTLAELATLPPGWGAHREAPGAPWRRVGPGSSSDLAAFVELARCVRRRESLGSRVSAGRGRSLP